jgi:hypothetical protein
LGCHPVAVVILHVKCINYSPWRLPFKGRNTLQWRIVLIKL